MQKSNNKMHVNVLSVPKTIARPRSAVVSVSDLKARSTRFDTRSVHIFSFLLPLIQEGQLSVTYESICIKYWLTA